MLYNLRPSVSYNLQSLFEASVDEHMLSPLCDIESWIALFEPLLKSSKKKLDSDNQHITDYFLPVDDGSSAD